MTTITRRSFLSGAAVLAVPAGLSPEAAAIKTAATAAQPAVEVVTMHCLQLHLIGLERPDEGFKPGHSMMGIGGTPESAERLLAKATRHSITRNEIITHPVEATFPGTMFRVITICANEMRCRYKDGTEIWDESFMPTHYLEVKPLTCSDGDVGTEGYMSRAEAIQEAAEANAEILDAAKTTRDVQQWSLVIEVGELMSEAQWDISLEEGDGFGFQTIDARRPVRVIHPTAEEIEQYGGEGIEWTTSPAEATEGRCPLNRRTFLSGTALLAVPNLSPIGDVGRVPSEMATLPKLTKRPVEEFPLYLVGLLDKKREGIPDDNAGLYGVTDTIEAAERVKAQWEPFMTKYRPDKALIIREVAGRFPGTRFRILNINNWHYEPWNDSDDDVEQYPEAWCPAHALDIPPSIDDGSYGRSGYLSREKAFAKAAARNRKVLDCIQYAGEIKEKQWRVVVEIGEAKPTYWDVSMAHGQPFGFQSVNCVSLTRLVQPTQAEIDRWGGEPVEWNVT